MPQGENMPNCPEVGTELKYWVTEGIATICAHCYIIVQAEIWELRFKASLNAFDLLVM